MTSDSAGTDPCPHDSWSGDEGPVALLGRMPTRWRCDGCGYVRHDDPCLCSACDSAGAERAERSYRTVTGEGDLSNWRRNVGPYVVMAQEGKDGFIVGIYGPFGTADQASEAAIRNSVDGIKAAPLPLHATTALGTW